MSPHDIREVARLCDGAGNAIRGVALALEQGRPLALARAVGEMTDVLRRLAAKETELAAMVRAGTTGTLS